MKKLVPLTLFALVLASYAMLVSTVLANPYVWVYDENGNLCDVFNIGDKLRIQAYDSSTPYRIRVYDPNGNINNEWISNTANFDSGLVTNATSMLGRWTVRTTNYECKFAVGMYNVIPEISFGILGILGACFAGFGLKYLRAKRKV